MADAQTPVGAAVSPIQALVQGPPVAAANVENPQQNQAPLRYNFCLFYSLVFPWLVFALSPFPPLRRQRGCSFRPLVFILSFVRLCFAYADWLFCSVFVPFCTPFIHHVSVLRLANTGFL